MKIGNLIHFHDERFFDGAVQLRWVETQPEKARQATEAFVFHGPRYHGANTAENDGIEEGYRLKDSASFIRDLIHSLQAGLRGEEENPYWMVVAGYGSGKSHLALTCATLLGKQAGVTESVLEHIEQADADLGAEVREQISRLDKPVLVLPLDGMAGFHLGNALSQAVFAQLRHYGIDASAIRDLSPRFQTAEQFVQRNYSFRCDSFSQYLPGLDANTICARLRDNDEDIYTAVDAIYTEANGSPIPVIGQESAQELINTLCEVYCGPGGAFSSVVILFDEFGRYLEYAADKPRLAGDAALQQIFQGVQDNSGKVRLIGFIQYELKAYLKRFGSADLRQLQRYITRFDAAKKWYLSTNLETIFAHMIGKNESEVAPLWKQGENQWQTSWRYLSQSLPGFQRIQVWGDFEQFSRVIGRGCWPLHPLATWFLTRQRDVVQSRSALIFIKDIIEHVANEDAFTEGGLRQIGAAELVLKSLLSELIAAERETGATTAETLQLLLEKFKAHLNPEQQRVLAGVAVLTKMRVGKHSQDTMDRLIGEAAALESGKVSAALRVLGQELGALEWNRDLGQYELIADAASRGQFQQWLRKKLMAFSIDAVRDLFIRRCAKDSELGSIDSDFGHHRDIRTTEWIFEAQFAHIHTLESAVQRAFREWQEAIAPNEAKGRVIYLYLHTDDDLPSLQIKLQTKLQFELERIGQAKAPIWIIALSDTQGAIAEHIGRLEIFDESTPDDVERFRRFIPEERERSRLALREAVQGAIRERIWWVAGMTEAPSGRLKTVTEAIFAAVYPDALPFPFDGFASGPGGPADAAQLSRHLATGQVDGNWVQTQPVRLRNRVLAVLVNSWRSLQADGRLIAPAEPCVKAAYDRLEQSHKNQPGLTLLSSFQTLIAPPYGMNASSASLLLGLLLGANHPPRRIELNGEMVASSDWVEQAFSNKHYLKREILDKTGLRFLAEDSESRWRSFLDAWECERNYQKLETIGNKATALLRADPIPEILEERYKRLQATSDDARHKLLAFSSNIEKWERGIERAERSNDVGELLRIGSLIYKQWEELEDNPCWSNAHLGDCDKLLVPLKQMVSTWISEWIPRQSCNSAMQVGDFRHRMDKAGTSLKELGFKREAGVLEQQARQAIMRVEERQRYKMTLDESDDYPRQPIPAESTPVRELIDQITQGDRIMEALASVKEVLDSDEFNARIGSIKSRQEKLQAILKRHRESLGRLYSNIESERALQEVLVKARYLRDIFVETRDEQELSDLLFQLESIQANISSWESGDVSPERLSELLEQQIPHQVHDLRELLESRDIEPAWDLDALYMTLSAERINSLRVRSSEWLRPKLALESQIPQMDHHLCKALERELAEAPFYLARDDTKHVERLSAMARLRREELEERQRLDKVATWQAPFLSLFDIEMLDLRTTELLLKNIRNPPCELIQQEEVILESIEAKLIAHLDYLSMDEIIGRIERLPIERQRELLMLLFKRLG